MKRILQLSKYYLPYKGGIEDIVFSIVNTFKNDYEQHIICFNHEKGESITNEVNGIPVYRAKVIKTLFSQALSVDYYKELRRQILSFKPDIIHVHLPNPLVCFFLERLLRHTTAKLIIHWHSDILYKPTTYALIESFEKYVLKHADKILTTTLEYAQASQPLRPFLNKVIALPSIINEDKMAFTPVDNDKLLHLKEQYHNHPIVFFVGRHVLYKGIIYLLKTLPYLSPDVEMVIAGEGKITPLLKEKTISCTNVHFVGKIPDDEMKIYFRLATVFAFPSIDRREAYGLSLAEALYCGTPAVTFNVKGSGLLWLNQNNETGLVVPNKNVEAFANALNTIINDPSLRERLSQGASKRIHDNCLKDQMHILKEVYESI